MSVSVVKRVVFNLLVGTLTLQDMVEVQRIILFQFIYPILLYQVVLQQSVIPVY